MTGKSPVEGLCPIKYSFDKFVLNYDQRELTADGAPIGVEPQVFDLLALLIAHRERVVSRDELIETIWQGRFVSDAAVSSRIRDARAAIGDSGARQAYIKTLHGRGFRFVGKVITETASSTVKSVVPPPIDDRPSIAVLPFKNQSADEGQDYFVDGICEDIINDLSRLKWLFVIARNSTHPYKGSLLEPGTIGRELGVRYLLDGSIRRNGERVRITVKLLECNTANPIWIENFDRELKDIFAVQDQITQCIVATLETQVSSAEGQRSRQKREQNLDAWEHVIQAMALVGEFTNDASARALELLDKAIEIDPSYARAYSQKAWTTAWRIHQGWEDTDTKLPVAIEAAEQAVKHDPEEPWAYIGWLFIATILRDADMLVESAKRSLEINPNFAMAHSWMGAAYALSGRGEKSLEWIENARRLSPRDMFKEEFDVHTSYAYFQLSDYANACKYASKATLPRPDHVYPRLILATSLAHRGKIDLANIQAAKILQLVPEFSLEEAEKSCVFVQDDDIKRFVDGLRLAGLS